MGGKCGTGGLAIAWYDIDDPGGTPASISNSPSRNGVSGASSAGFKITVQPVAMAGPIFQMLAPSGPFHGMMAPTTPIGSFNV